MIAILVVARTLGGSDALLSPWTAGLGALALISPASALVVLVAVVPFSEWMVLDGVGLKVVIVALIGMGLVLRLALVPRRRPVVLPIRWAGVVLVATALSVLHTVIRMPDLGSPAVIAWLSGIGGGLIVLSAGWAAAADRNLRPVVAAVSALVVGAAASLAEFLAPGMVRGSELSWLLRPDRLGLPRVTGIIPAPNAVATVLLGALAVLVVAILLGPGRRRLVLIVPAIVVAVTIVLTYSRSGLLGMFAIGVLLVAWRRPRAAIVVLAAGLVASVIAIPAYLRFRGAALGSGEISDLGALLSGDVARLEGWMAALRMWWQEPLTGFGFLSFRVLAQDFGTTYVTAPHNELLRLLAEGGTGVAIVFVVLLVVTIRALWRSDTPLGLAGLGALVAILLGGMFNNPFIYIQVTAPIFTIVGAALGSARRRDVDSVLR